jgi:hypothetical protein
MRLAVLASTFALALAACSGSPAAPIDPPGGGSSSSGGVSTTAPVSSFTGGTSGCRGLVAFRASADETQYLVVDADVDKLGLKPGATGTFDLAKAPDGLRVTVDVFDRAEAEAPYCTDYRVDDQKPTTWVAEGGTVFVTIQAPSTANGTYRASIRMKDVRLVGPQRGVAGSIPNAMLEDVLVGWLPG